MFVNFTFTLLIQVTATYLIVVFLVSSSGFQLVSPLALNLIAQLPFLVAVTNQPVCVVTNFFPTFFLTVIFEVLQDPLELTDSANPAFDFMVNLTVFFSAKFFGTVGDTWVFKEIIGTGVGVAEGGVVGGGVVGGVGTQLKLQIIK